MASDDSESMLSAERQKSSTISKQMRSARNLDQSRMNTPHTSRYDRSVIQTNLRTSDTMRESELDLAAGSLLQDRLREVKAARLQDSMKAKGGSRLSENIRETQSSPSVSHQSRKRKSDVASSTATRVVTGDLQRSMGAKAMEEV